MTTFLVILAVVIIALLLYLASLDGNYHVDRSLVINAPVGDVYNTVVDFKTWPSWSPWLLHEPQTEIVYSDNYQQPGGYYTWDGKLVGSGKLIHEQLNTNKSIQQRIEFIRPFKSINQVSWTFREIDNNTEVHWIMQGKMPFLFRFMTKMTVSMIGRDYDLGLHLLNGFMDKNNSHPRIKFYGKESLQPFSYVYKPFKGHLNEMVTFMQASFPDLVESVDKLGITQGKPVTIYHKMDGTKLYFECEVAVPVNNQAPVQDLSIKSFHGGTYYKIECLGDYQFLELAWYKAISHIKMLKLKIDKSRPYLDVYENNPDEVSHKNEIRTSLYVPIK